MKNTYFLVLFLTLGTHLAFAAGKKTFFVYDGPEFQLDAEFDELRLGQVDTKSFKFVYKSPSRDLLSVTTKQYILSSLGDRPFTISQSQLRSPVRKSSIPREAAQDHFEITLSPNDLPNNVAVNQIWLFPDTGEVIFNFKKSNQTGSETIRSFYMHRQVVESQNFKAQIAIQKIE